MEDQKEVVLIGAEEMARILNISKEGLRQRLYRDKNIPHFKIIGVIKFDKEKVLEYFRRGANVETN